LIFQLLFFYSNSVSSAEQELAVIRSDCRWVPTFLMLHQEGIIYFNLK